MAVLMAIVQLRTVLRAVLTPVILRAPGAHRAPMRPVETSLRPDGLRARLTGPFGAGAMMTRVHNDPHAIALVAPPRGPIRVAIARGLIVVPVLPPLLGGPRERETGAPPAAVLRIRVRPATEIGPAVRSVLTGPNDRPLVTGRPPAGGRRPALALLTHGRSVTGIVRLA